MTLTIIGSCLGLLALLWIARARRRNRIEVMGSLEQFRQILPPPPKFAPNYKVFKHPAWDAPELSEFTPE